MIKSLKLPTENNLNLIITCFLKLLKSIIKISFDKIAKGNKNSGKNVLVRLFVVWLNVPNKVENMQKNIGTSITRFL